MNPHLQIDQAGFVCHYGNGTDPLSIDDDDDEADELGTHRPIRSIENRVISSIENNTEMNTGPRRGSVIPGILSDKPSSDHMARSEYRASCPTGSSPDKTTKNERKSRHIHQYLASYNPTERSMGPGPVKRQDAALEPARGVGEYATSGSGGIYMDILPMSVQSSLLLLIRVSNRQGLGIALLLLSTKLRVLGELPYSVVHGDLKLDDMLMCFDNTEVLSNFVNRAIYKPAEYILDTDGRQVFYSNKDPSEVKVHSGKIFPFITDFGAAVRFRGESGRRMMPIQANSYCAPEVTLSFLWDTSADIWDL